MMDKSQKLKVVSELVKRGVFMIKGAVDRVAQSLSVTRFTIYNYLDELGQADKSITPAARKQVAKKAAPKRRA
jgi:predicted transcriptional regulator YheO